MTFKTFYEIKFDDRTVTAETYKINDGMVVFQHYPNQNIITPEILRLDSTTTHIPKERLVEIEEREIRF